MEAEPVSWGQRQKTQQDCLSQECAFWSWTHHSREVFQGSASCGRASSCWLTGVKLPPFLCGIIKAFGWTLHSFAKGDGWFCLTLTFQCQALWSALKIPAVFCDSIHNRCGSESICNGERGSIYKIFTSLRKKKKKGNAWQHLLFQAQTLC